MAFACVNAAMCEPGSHPLSLLLDLVEGGGFQHTEHCQAVPSLSELNGQYKWYRMEVCSDSHGVAKAGCCRCDIVMLQPVQLNCYVSTK
jgi:hypothetical protein